MLQEKIRMVNDKEAMGLFKDAIRLLAAAWDFTNWINENYPELYDEYAKLNITI